MVDAQEMRQKHSSKAETRTQETGKLNDHPRQEVTPEFLEPRTVLPSMAKGTEQID